MIEPDSEAFTMVADERDFDGYGVGDIEEAGDDAFGAGYSDDDDI